MTNQKSNQTNVTNDILIGTVKSLSPQKDYGTLSSSSDGESYRFYRHSINLKFDALKPGDIVSFEVTVSKNSGIKYARYLKPVVYFDSEQIKESYDYAAEHALIQDSPEDDRTPQQRFRDAFRGKLGETALLTYVSEHLKDVSAFRDSGSGIDDFGLSVDGKHVSVKSVRQHSAFLMIARDSFDDNGNLVSGCDVNPDAFALVRVDVRNLDGSATPGDRDGIDIMKPLDDLLREEADRTPETVCAEIFGGITRAEFWKGMHFAEQGTARRGMTLSGICRGYAVEPPEAADGYVRSVPLKDDSFIQSCAELYPVEDMFDALQAG